METTTEPQGEKRKRSPESVGSQGPGRIPQAPRLTDNVASAGVTQINYLVKARNDRLKLVEGDSETFGDVLTMLDDYEGVLQRRESFASNLGAKLVGPLLLKSFEKLFDGPIKVITSSYNHEQTPITWLDIVSFARTNPTEFVLSDTVHNVKVCRFWVNGGQFEISEDDYRLIMSGAPERMIPSQPIPEDENSELGTLNILETRLGMLIKKADAVASKARQLNYHLKGRKNVIMARKAPEAEAFSPQPFSAINRSRSPAPINGEAAKLQQDLLEQFHSPHRRQSLPSQPRSKQPRPDHSNFHTFNGGADQRMSHPLSNSDDGTEGQYRVLMASRIEKLHKGEPINPPCDRCRRLKFVCTKHMTACGACTKKHAKCSWKDVKEGEMEATMAPQRDSPVASEDGFLVVDKKTPERTNLATLNANLPVHKGQNLSGLEDLRSETPSNVPVTVSPQAKPERRMSAEHALLAQMASAAAAAGNHQV
ncbi:C6 finger domain-containing protein [Rutstroemia sp. NJR-2017a WRK4]|nr:C6 finger domain-containing protein [Rutstroemia sp. NJR-2017a WRK4]